MAWNTRRRLTSSPNNSIAIDDMRRGEIYRVLRPEGDVRPARTFVVVSRQTLIDSSYSTVICAPIFTNGSGLSTHVQVGPNHGLKHDSSIICDHLRSLHKTDLTHFVGTLSYAKLAELDEALRVALALD
jgi:mRNA interferase MazF